jgi:hypothetical protein
MYPLGTERAGSIRSDISLMLDQGMVAGNEEQRAKRYQK